MARRTKKFDASKVDYITAFPSKKDAEDFKKRWKAKGYYIRIRKEKIRGKQEYGIYGYKG